MGYNPGKLQHVKMDAIMTNMFTGNPQRGDAVVGNTTTGKVEYITAGSFSLSALPSNYETIGAVFKRYGRNVGVVYKYNAAKAYCPYIFWKVTGYTIGSAVSGTLTYYTTSGTKTTLTLTSFTPTSKQDLCDQLNTQFSAVSELVSQKWLAYVDDDGSVIVLQKFTHYMQQTNSLSGLRWSCVTLPDVPSYTGGRQKNGYSSSQGIINMPRAEYYLRNTANANAADFKVSAAITSIRYRPVTLDCWTDTDNNYCAVLKAEYGDGEAGWLKFLESCRMVHPGYGAFGEDVEYSKYYTELEASKTLPSVYLEKYTDITDATLCPAVAYCHGIATTCLPVGSFFMPAMMTLADLSDGITYGTGTLASDKMNTTLSRMGGNTIPNSAILWSVSRRDAFYGWVVSGSCGCGWAYTLCNSYRALSCSLLNLDS